MDLIPAERVARERRGAVRGVVAVEQHHDVLELGACRRVDDVHSAGCDVTRPDRHLPIGGDREPLAARPLGEHPILPRRPLRLALDDPLAGPALEREHLEAQLAAGGHLRLPLPLDEEGALVPGAVPLVHADHDRPALVVDRPSLAVLDDDGAGDFDELLLLRRRTRGAERSERNGECEGGETQGPAGHGDLLELERTGGR